jgi:hypothetical protein
MGFICWWVVMLSGLCKGVGVGAEKCRVERVCIVLDFGSVGLVGV